MITSGHQNSLVPPHANTDGRPPVTEIYPGAATRRPIRARQSWTWGGEQGMATAEYAIATLAAVGFAGLLVVILRSEEVRVFLLAIIRSALSLQ
jgi:Protein of unknown function (DUF4244)